MNSCGNCSNPLSEDYQVCGSCGWAVPDASVGFRLQYLCLLPIILCSCATTTITTGPEKDPFAEALEEMNKPIILGVFQPVVCKGKVIVVFDKIDQGQDVSYLDNTGYWLTFNKKDCEDKNE